MVYFPDRIHFKHNTELPVYRDPSFLHQKYVVKKLSIAQIASQTFSSKPTIQKALREAGILTRGAHAHHGRTKQVEYGSKKINGRKEKHISEQRVIRAIVGLQSKGLSLRQIAAFLSQTGVPTKCKGLKWHPMMVKRILDTHPSKIESTIDLLDQSPR